MSASGEFDLIARHFAPLSAKAPLAFNLTDDAAIIAPPRGHSLVVTVDAIVEGVHYLADDPPDLVARKLLRVNLSDLAAKGARPTGYFLTAAFPRHAEPGWVAAFAKGLRRDQATYGITLMGGDTVATPGPATFSVTLYGLVKGRSMIRRAGARPGHLVCVTGTIGDGGFGLAERLTPHAALSPRERTEIVNRYRLPQPRVAFGLGLKPFASAAMDVSDGLLQDLGHLARASGLKALVETARVPLSKPGARLEAADPAARTRALTAGDDYEIVFTMPPGRRAAMERWARLSKTAVTVIGRVETGIGVVCQDADGRQWAPEKGGFDHFAPR